ARGLPMLEIFLKLLCDLPDWEVYREVAAVLEDAHDLVAWRRLYGSHPNRKALLDEAARTLTVEARRRFPDLVQREPSVAPARWSGQGGRFNACGEWLGTSPTLCARGPWPFAR